MTNVKSVAYYATPSNAGRYPTERKTAAATAACAVVMFVILAVSDAVQGGSTVLPLPPWLEPFVVAAAPAAATFAAGWLTKHQQRSNFAGQPNNRAGFHSEGDTPNVTAPRGAHRRAL